MEQPRARIHSTSALYRIRGPPKKTRTPFSHASGRLSRNKCAAYAVYSPIRREPAIDCTCTQCLQKPAEAAAAAPGGAAPAPADAAAGTAATETPAPDTAQTAEAKREGFLLCAFATSYALGTRRELHHMHMYNVLRRVKSLGIKCECMCNWMQKSVRSSLKSTSVRSCHS